MDIKIVAMILGLMIGVGMLSVVTVVYLKHQRLGPSGAILSLFGIVLMGMSVWQTVKISVDAKGVVKTELMQRIESVEAEQKKVVNKITNVEKATEGIREDFGHLTSRFFIAIDTLRDIEAALPEDEQQKRQTIYERFASDMEKLSPHDRLRQQEFFTRGHLRNLEIDLPQLKSILKKAGYYDGEIDDVFNASVAKAIEDLQRNEKITPVDGIFGPITYQALAKMLGK